MGAIALGVIGAATGSGGAFLTGKSGDQQRKRLTTLQDMPGIDVGATTNESLSNLERYLPRASQISLRTGLANQATTNAMEESALPGAGAARAAELGNINSLLAGQLPQSVIDSLKRGAAASNLSTFGASGLGAGSVGSANTLRQLGLGQLGGIQLGSGMLGNLLAGLRIANTPGAENFFGPSPNALINLRSQERTQRLNIGMQAAGVQGMTGAFGNYLSQQGGLLEGAALGGMGGVGGMGGGSNSSYITPNGTNYALPSNWGSLSSGQQAQYKNGLNWASNYTGPTE